MIHRHFAGLSKNTFLLALSSLFADISTEMLYPVLPLFLTQTLRASGSVVGLVDGLAQATQNVVQGFSGALSDRLQRRKPLALFGYALAAIAKPLMGMATIWQGLFAARLLDRLGAGTRSAPRDALIAASVDDGAAVKAIPWPVILMVCGVSVLIGVLEKTGGMDLFTTLLAKRLS